MSMSSQSSEHDLRRCKPPLKRRKLISNSDLSTDVSVNSSEKLSKNLTLELTNFEDILRAVCLNQIDFKFKTKQEETQFWHNVLYAIGSHMIEMSEEFKHDDHLCRIFFGSWILYTIAITNS